MVNIKVNNLESKLETDNPDLIQALYELYTVKVPGSEYSPSYRTNRWDGKKRFFTKGGKFKTGLLGSILNNLAKLECVPKVEWGFDITKPIGDYLIKGIKLYPDQKDLVLRALASPRAIIKAPTGYGKTLIMASLVKSLETHKIVILTNAISLIKQTCQFLEETCGMDDIGFCFGSNFKDGRVMLCTVQSIEKLYNSGDYIENADVLMVDEVHEFSKGKTTLAVINGFANAIYRYGFTATPPTDPLARMELEAAFGDILETTSLTDLFDEKRLTPPKIWMIDLPADCETDDHTEYRDLYVNNIVHNDVRNSAIRKIIEKIVEKNSLAKVLVLVKDLSHLEALWPLISMHADCYSLQGADDIDIRYKTITKFVQTNKPVVLIGTKILQTGINIKEITHFINARGLKSPIATIQALGRALRASDNKEVVHVYDFLDKGKYLEAHSKKRLNTYKKEKLEIEII